MKRSASTAKGSIQGHQSWSQRRMWPNTGRFSRMLGDAAALDKRIHSHRLKEKQLTSISTGGAGNFDLSYAIRVDSTVICADGSGARWADLASKHPEDGKFQSFSSGGRFVCAIRDNQTVECWGLHRAETGRIFIAPRQLALVTVAFVDVVGHFLAFEKSPR